MRSVTLTQAAAITNTNSSNGNPVATQDDNYRRTLRHVWVYPQTVGLTVFIRRAGYPIRQFDASRCAAGNWPVEVNEDWPPTIPFTVDYANNTGGSVTPVIICSYDVPDHQ